MPDSGVRRIVDTARARTGTASPRHGSSKKYPPYIGDGALSQRPGVVIALPGNWIAYLLPVRDGVKRAGELAHRLGAAGLSKRECRSAWWSGQRGPGAPARSAGRRPL